MTRPDRPDPRPPLSCQHEHLVASPVFPALRGYGASASCRSPPPGGMRTRHLGLLSAAGPDVETDPFSIVPPAPDGPGSVPYRAELRPCVGSLLAELVRDWTKRNEKTLRVSRAFVS